MRRSRTPTERAVIAERARIRSRLRDLRGKWYGRSIDAKTTRLFEGAYRAVQALDEAIRATRRRR